MTTPQVTLTTSAFDFQRDLGRYWRQARKLGEVTLTQQGWVYKSTFRTFLTALNLAESPADEQSNGRMWFIRRLLTAMNELTGSSFDHMLKANPKGRLLAMPMAQRVRWTFEIWRDSGAWNELLRIPSPADSMDPRRESPVALGKARLALLRTLNRLASDTPGGSGEWLSPLGLISRLKRTEYQFLFERRHRSAYGGLYTSPYYGPNNPYGATFNAVKDEASGWDLVEHAFVINVLTGPLHWMGLVELGYDEDGQAQRGENAPPAAYRLTEAGAWLLGIGPEPLFVESGGKLIVQPNFTVLALEPISDAVLGELDHFAESQGGERAIAYQLTRESLYRGQQTGWDAARAVQFLEAHQGAPIPTNVRRSLEEWETSHRRITFHRNACLVQLADDDARAESAESLAPFQPQTLGAWFDLIGGRSADEVVTALRDAGWVPTLQTANDTASEAVLRATDNGDVIFTQSAPSIFVLGKLAQFSEKLSLPGKGDELVVRMGYEGMTRITPDSVRAAMTAGMPLDQLLATLADLHSGPVPEALEQNIRRWASFFGSATLREVVLLELSNLDVLVNLINDPQVGRYLTPIEGSVTPMALVDAARADEVRKMLVERGVKV